MANLFESNWSQPRCTYDSKEKKKKNNGRGPETQRDICEALARCNWCRSVATLNKVMLFGPEGLAPVIPTNLLVYNHEWSSRTTTQETMLKLVVEQAGDEAQVQTCIHVGS